MTNQSKQILSFLRDGDFAHPGEISAIDLMMSKIAKSKNRTILDVGCGLGGTAHYLQEKGFGKVTGIDIDESLIQVASKKYSDIQFFHCDVMNVHNVLNQKFDLIICMSSFFSFIDQKLTLLELKKIANKNAELIIFDYSKFSQDVIKTAFDWSETASLFYPIYLDDFKKILLETGWQYQSTQDITPQFKMWYQELLSKFEMKKDAIYSLFDKTHVDKMEAGYRKILKLICDKKVGGILVYAKLS